MKMDLFLWTCHLHRMFCAVVYLWFVLWSLGILDFEHFTDLCLMFRFCAIEECWDHIAFYYGNGFCFGIVNLPLLSAA